MYMAIKMKSHLQWLVDRLDEMFFSAGFKMLFLNHKQLITAALLYGPCKNQ